MRSGAKPVDAPEMTSRIDAPEASSRLQLFDLEAASAFLSYLAFSLADLRTRLAGPSGGRLSRPRTRRTGEHLVFCLVDPRHCAPSQPFREHRGLGALGCQPGVDYHLSASKLPALSRYAVIRGDRRLQCRTPASPAASRMVCVRALPLRRASLLAGVARRMPVRLLTLRTDLDDRWWAVHAGVLDSARGLGDVAPSRGRVGSSHLRGRHGAAARRAISAVGRNFRERHALRRDCDRVCCALGLR